MNMVPARQVSYMQYPYIHIPIVIESAVGGGIRVATVKFGLMLLVLHYIPQIHMG